MESLLIAKLIVFLINVFGAWLIFWVYLGAKSTEIKQWFIFLVVSSLLWTDFAFLARVAGQFNLEWSLVCTKITFSAVPLFFIAFYFFILHFLHLKNQKITQYIILISGLSYWFVIVFTNLIVTNVKFVQGSYFYILGPGKIYFYSGVLFYMILGLVIPFKNYFKISREQRLKIQYLLVGIFFLYVMNFIFNVFFPLFKNTTRYNQLGDYSNFLFLSFAAFAIVKRKLFEIKVVLTQLLVGFIAILLLVNVVGSESAFEYIWKGSLFVAFLVTGALLIKSVLNEIKRREQLEKVTAQLRGANVKLRELDQAKTEFLAIASHQLRTPLTAIRGYLSMLRRGDYGQVPTDFADPLREVYQSTLRLAKLTNRLLDATRIETGRLKINLGPVSLGGLISSVVDELKSQAKEKNLYLKFLKPKEKLPPLPLDLEKIRQVFLNIIDNGLKYTQKGGIKISLGLVGVDRVQVKIQDTGEGITEEELKKIFQSFSRGLAGEKFHTAGAGLGLYIAKEFVELHQGKIWATSPGAGKGTTIWIELPSKSNQAKTEKDLASFSGGKKKKLPR